MDEQDGFEQHTGSRFFDVFKVSPSAKLYKYGADERQVRVPQRPLTRREGDQMSNAVARAERTDYTRENWP